MPDLSTVDWKAVGAVAGPVLALVALAWQASERLRKPVLDCWYRPDAAGRMQHSDSDPVKKPWCVYLQASVRVVNPRPAAIIVESVELQSRESRWPWGRHRLRRKALVAQIPPHSEAAFDTYYDNLSGPVTLRLRIRLRGRRRTLSTKWERVGERVFTGDEVDYAYGGYRTPSDPFYPPTT